MSPEECVENGGHCFERDGITYASIPPQYPETCKHCHKHRVAVPAPPFHIPRCSVTFLSHLREREL